MAVDGVDGSSFLGAGLLGVMVVGPRVVVAWV